MKSGVISLLLTNWNFGYNFKQFLYIHQTSYYQGLGGENKSTVFIMDCGVWIKTKNFLKYQESSNPQGNHRSTHKVTYTEIFFSWGHQIFLCTYIFFWHMEYWGNLPLSFGDVAIITDFIGKEDDCSNIFLTLLLLFLVIIHGIVELGVGILSRFISRNMSMGNFKLRDPRALMFSK